MELFSQIKDQPIFEWFLIQDSLLPLPRWFFILCISAFDLLAWSFHDDFGVSWWGAIWRTLVALVASVALGYGAALIVRDTGPKITNDSKTIESASVWVGFGVFVIATWWLITYFNGAKAAGEQRQHQSSAIPQAPQRITPLPVAAIRQRPPWVVILLSLFSFGLYFPVWLGQTWSELKRIVRDQGKSPVWHALTLFVPIYNLFRLHAHFRTINEQSVLRALPRRMPAGIAVAGLFVVGLLWRAARLIPDGATWITVVGAADLLLAAILATGQSALNRVWEHDFGTASERKLAAGEWLAVIVLGIGFALIFSLWEGINPPDLELPSSWGFAEIFDRT
jgi:hypothetical protein